ncbi:hypothetical protein D3C84_502980 [compost metagenome]
MAVLQFQEGLQRLHARARRQVGRLGRVAVDAPGQVVGVDGVTEDDVVTAAASDGVAAHRHRSGATGATIERRGQVAGLLDDIHLADRAIDDGQVVLGDIVETDLRVVVVVREVTHFEHEAVGARTNGIGRDGHVVAQGRRQHVGVDVEPTAIDQLLQLPGELVVAAAEVRGPVLEAEAGVLVARHGHVGGGRRGGGAAAAIGDAQMVFAACFAGDCATAIADAHIGVAGGPVRSTVEARRIVEVRMDR